jgi:hypothetical protein
MWSQATLIGAAQPPCACTPTDPNLCSDRNHSSFTMARLHPMLVACGSALIIDCCSNVIAQRLKAWSDEKPFVFDRVLFFQFAFMVVLTAPVNYHWQHWLERTFPGWRMIKQTRSITTEDGDAAEKAVFLKEDGENKRMVEEEVLQRDWFNIFKKWFTDVSWSLSCGQAITN